MAEPSARDDLRRRLESLSPERRAALARARRARASPSATDVAAGADDDVPLSSAQERMWLLDQLSPSGYVYGTAVRLRGTLQPGAVRAAVRAIVTRHEPLRTLIPASGAGRLGPVDVTVGLVDLTGLAPEHRDGAVAGALRTLARLPFDLGCGPLVRTRLLRTGRTEHVLVFAAHHVAVDGWSLGLLVDEFGAHYRMQAGGRPPTLPPPISSYRRFARWQAERMSGEEGERLRRFWRRQVADLPVLALPVDRQHGTDGRAGRRAMCWRVPHTVTEALRRQVADEGASLFVLLLSALHITLRDVTGQSDLVVATTVAGRHHPDWQRLIGCFVNTLLLRTDLTGAVSGPEVVLRTRRTVVDALAHQELPHEALLAEIRDASGSGATAGRALKVLCTVSERSPVPDLPGLTVDALDVDLRTAPFDLCVDARPVDDDGLEITMHVDDAAFTTATADAIGRRLRRAVRGLAGEAAAPVVVAPRPESRDEARPWVPVHDLVRRQAESRPDAVAVVDGGRAVTHRELERRVVHLARHLLADGLVPEDVVGVHLPRSVEFVVAALAVLRAGGAVLPLDPSWPPVRLARMLASGGGNRVVGPDVDPFPEGTGRFPPYPSGVAGPGRTPGRVHPDQLGWVVHTSGSTGGTKGVPVTHDGIANRCAWGLRALPPVHGRRCLSRTPIGFVDVVWEVLGPLVGGATLVVVPDAEAADPRLLARRLRRDRVARLSVVPTVLDLLLTELEKDGLGPAAPEVCVCSGEPLSAGLAARVHRLLPGALLLNVYGSSEVTADATAADVVPDDRRAFVPIGRPIGGVHVSVRSPTGPRGVLAVGEIVVGGRGVARGYMDDPAGTAMRFAPDPGGPPGSRAFWTGDRGRERADGALEFLGRLDAQLTVRGVRVEPAEVEATLRDCPGVVGAAVCLRPAGGPDPILVADVVGDRPLDPAVVRAHAAARLPGPMVPSVVRPVPALPTTPTGKIDRTALAPLAATAPDRAVDQPVGPAEAVVAQTFADALPAGAVGRHDDFFALGGHSLLAARVAVRLEEALGVPVGLVDLLDAPTVARLAACLADRAPDPAGPTSDADPAAAHDPFPLTEVQQAYLRGRSSGFALGGVSTYGYVEIDAPDLDVGRFVHAVRSLIDRHPMLRAVFADGTQRVLPAVPPYEPSVADLSTCTPEDRRQALASVREQMSHEVLPADRWPLFDLRLSRLGAGAVRIHFGIDALVCDARSFGILMDELARAYHRPDTPFLPVGVRFRDWVLDEQRRRAGPRHARAVDYWNQRLGQLPPGPELPTVPAEVAAPRFRRRNGRLAAADWAEFRRRAAAHGVTPSAALLAAFAEVVSTWSARGHYSVVLTVFNRRHPHRDIEKVVGDFTSLSLLEIDHTRIGGFAARAAAVQATLWADLDNSAVSAVEVARRWAGLHGAEPGTLAPVVFTSNLADPVEPTDATPPIGEVVHGITQTPQVLLDHQVSDVAGILQYNWDAVEDRFAPGVLDAMFDAYRGVLRTLVSQACSWDDPVRVTLPANQVARRIAVNRTIAPVPARGLHEAVRDTAERVPEATAVVDGSVRLSYRELVRAARAVAGRLRDVGVGVGDLVGIDTRKGWQQAVAALAVLEAGAAFVPLDPDLPPARLARLVEIAAPAALLCERPRRSGVTGPVPVLAVEDCLTDRDPGELPAVAGTALAYAIFTSGSTGEPKAVLIDHRAAANTLAAVNLRGRVGTGDRVLAVSSLSFDLGVYDLFGSWAVGACVVLPGHQERRDPGRWISLIEQWSVTVWNSVPALAELLVERADSLGRGLGSLRLVLLSGDWVPVGLPGRIRDLAEPVQVVSMGGATEVAIWSVWFPVEQVDPAWTSIPYGQPLENQTVHVLDDTGRPRPDWVPGELYIGGVGTARGYLKDPERTAAAFRTVPGVDGTVYRTGDLVRFRDDGNLEFLGRQDNQVKISGHRIELGEIEAALCRQPGVRDAVVVAVGGRGSARRLVGAVVPAQQPGPEAAALRAALGRTLPAALVPGEIQTVASFPLTANGKVDRPALAQSLRRPVGVDVPGTDGLRKVVAEIWQEVLDIAPPGPDDSFFELGGTSLGAMGVLNEVQRRLGVDVPLVDLYREPTPGRFATVLADAGADPATVSPSGAPSRPAPALVPDPEGRFDPFPLTDVQAAYLTGRLGGAVLGHTATHSYAEIDVAELDVDRLDDVLHHLVDRHDALRTVILRSAEQQVLAEVPGYRIPFRDLRGLSDTDVEEVVGRTRAEMSHRVAPLGAWPLFDVRVHRLTEHTSRLYVSLDLLIADAHSVHVLTTELFTLYHDPDHVLPPLGCRYRDYVLAVRGRDGDPSRRAARAHWERAVADLPPAPRLPQRRAAAEIEVPRFERLLTSVPAATWTELKRRAAGVGVTASGLVCTVYCDVLRTWGEDPEFTLNLTTFNRLPLHPDINQVVGDFTTTTLLAVRGGGDGTFAERARRLQEQVWRDLEHRGVSGVEVLRMLRRARPRADTLMPVVFTSMLMPEIAGDEEPPVWSSEAVYSVSQTPQVLLDHQISEDGGVLTCTWDHVAEAFPEGLVSTMFGEFADRLRALGADDAAWGRSVPGDAGSR